MNAQESAPDISQYMSLRSAIQALGEAGAIRAILAANEKKQEPTTATTEPLPRPALAGAA